MTEIEVKRAVRKRDGFKCVECGLTNEEHILEFGRCLDVHRKKPGSKYTVRGCITLCRPCHKTKPRSPYGTTRTKRAVTIHPAFVPVLTELADYYCQSLRMQVHEAILEYLKAKGRWPA